jgi:prepilin signal peptidase PulO-like enzyme (type II secretory pathway)
MVVGVVLGWCAGWASSALVVRVVREQKVGGRWSALVPDPLAQAALAAIGGLLPLLTPGPWWRWLLAGLLAVSPVQVAVSDLRAGYVYTAVALVGIALGVACAPIVHDSAWWWGAAGAAIGLVVFGAIYGLGRLLYRGGEPLALGDVTIAALVGAVAGPYVLSALVVGVLASGVAALGVLVVRRSRHAPMPYGPGLCLGALLTLFVS